MISLDDMDRAILRAYQQNGNSTVLAIANKIGLSQPATSKRVKRLQKSGVIKGFHFPLDQKMLGFDVTVFLGVKLATKGRVALSDFERAVSAIPEVLLVQHVLGLYDYRLKVVARDISDFERVLRRRIMTLPGVGDVEANVLLSEEKCPIHI